MPDNPESISKPRQTAEKHHKSKDEPQTAKRETMLSSVFVKDDTNHSVHVVEKPIEDAIDTFVESAKVCISVLENLSDVHPFIAVPVLAFKLVVSLDLKRRENNAKVLAVKTQMLSMMSALYQLRNVKDPDDIGKDGEPLRGRLQTLMEEMERSIKDCGSACDVYMKKSFLRKYLKASLYEARLASYASQFVELKSELLFAISVHSTLGVDAANTKLDDQKVALGDMKLQLQEILVRLDTPREREIRSIIEDNSGASACVQNRQILNELVEKTGENLGGSSSTKEDIDISTIQESLFKELAEDIDTAFKQNFALFSGKLDIQRKEIDEAMNILKRQGDQIIAYFSGGHERIVDPQLRKIWKEMGWKSTVKARHFVLALRDFFMGELDHLEDPENVKTPDSQGPNQILSPPLTNGGTSEEAPHFNFHSTNDEWAKSYINITYLQPILEAIDDDGSAFINVKEVNTFALSRPEGWTLLQWLAYWAAGWQSSISTYKNKIYHTLRKMFKLLQKARPDNQRVLDAYLDNFNFFRLQSLLRSTRATTESGVTITPELAKLSEEFTVAEEKKLRENLESISYIIDSTATVSLITGPGRIERYIFPLLYLLLERHIKIFQLARKHIFHLDEMLTWSSSLFYVFSAFENRLQDVAAIFKQMHLNAERQFENFAFGMFKNSYGGLTWNISEITLRSVWEDLPEEPGDNEGLTEVPEDIPIDILKFGPQEPFELAPPVPFEVIVQPDDGPNIVQGNWAGYTTWSDGDPHEGLFRILFNETSEDGTTTGKADGYMGPLEMSASVTPAEEGSTYKVDFVMMYNDGYWIRCIGTLDTAAGKISGEWYVRRFVTELKPVPGSETDNFRCGPFELYRTPADLAQFRYSRKAFEENKARARWSFACAAIRYTVQRRLLTPEYVVSRLKKGRRFKELIVKRLNFNSGNTRRTEFTPEEKQELIEIENTVCPLVDQFYYSIARFVHYRITYHFGVTCDVCGRKIQQSRLLCIVCRTTVNNSLDFCIECHTAESVPVCEEHTGSHSLLRGDRFLHDCNRAWAMPIARKTSERLKEAFRSQAAIEKSLSDNHHEESTVPHEKDEAKSSPFKCFYCDDTISLPCWVCLECPGDVLVCDNCDKLNQYPKLPEKLVTTPPSLMHMMLRITDHKSVEIPDDEQLVRVEKKLAGVTNRVDEKLDRLQEMIQAQTKELESRLFDHFGAMAGKDQVIDIVEHDESKVSRVQVDMEGPKHDTSVKMVEHRLEVFEAKVEEKFDSMQGQFESLNARFSTVESLLREILSASQQRVVAATEA